GPGRERNVQREARGRTRTGLRCEARARIVMVEVQRQVEDTRILVEDVLRAVAVMHIPVDDQDALDAVFRLCSTRRDRDVVEQTEAHCAIRGRMMSGRTAQRERGPRAAAHDEVDGIDRTARGGCRRIPGRRRHDRIGVERDLRTRLRRPRDRSAYRLDMIGRVHAQQLLHRRVTRLVLEHVLEQRGRIALDRLHDRRQTTLMLGMTPARVVKAAVLVQDQRRRPGRYIVHVPASVALCAFRFASSTIRATSARSCCASYTMPSLIVYFTPPTRTISPFSFRRTVPVPYSTFRLCSGFSGTITRSARLPTRMMPNSGRRPFGSMSVSAPHSVAARITSSGWKPASWSSSSSRM